MCLVLMVLEVILVVLGVVLEVVLVLATTRKSDNYKRKIALRPRGNYQRKIVLRPRWRRPMWLSTNWSLRKMQLPQAMPLHTFATKTLRNGARLSRLWEGWVPLACVKKRVLLKVLVRPS